MSTTFDLHDRHPTPKAGDAPDWRILRDGVESWPYAATKTQAEMFALDLPHPECRGPDAPAHVVGDNLIDIDDEGRAVHELIFRLPAMPAHLAYRTTYALPTSKRHDARAWDDAPAECVLVKAVWETVRQWSEVIGVKYATRPTIEGPLSAVVEAFGAWKVERIDPGTYSEAVTFDIDKAKVEAYWRQDWSMIKVSGGRLNLTATDSTMTKCIARTAFYFRRQGS